MAICHVHMSLLGPSVLSPVPAVYTLTLKNPAIGRCGSLEITRRALPVLAYLREAE